MFEKMVLSSVGRRDRRLSKFFVGSSLAYMFLAGTALAVSIYVTDPKLTGSGRTISDGHVLIATSGSNRRPDYGLRTAGSARPNPYVVKRLDDILRTPALPRLPMTVSVPFDQLGMAPGNGHSGGDGGGGFPGLGLAVLDGAGDPPRPVDSSRKTRDPKQMEQPKNHAPMRVSPGVLQGKAIDRKTPEYPQIARAIHREGSVLVEVMISPEGRVESARLVSGDALLAKNAVDAAYGWRFQPTYLGDVPVRVTGIITFVFRLGQ